MCHNVNNRSVNKLAAVAQNIGVSTLPQSIFGGRMFQELLDVAINPVPKREYSNAPRSWDLQKCKEERSKGACKIEAE
jgi:hypothetical protein